MVGQKNLGNYGSNKFPWHFCVTDWPNEFGWWPLSWIFAVSSHVSRIFIYIEYVLFSYKFASIDLYLAISFLIWKLSARIKGKFCFSAAVKTVDDFSKIASLKDRKGDWENTAKEAIVSVERKMNAGEEIVAGKVKANLERYQIDL